ncbi:MAG: hypothetical protein ACON5N_06495 [Akkermansiaceae bacterium]
MAGPKEVAEPHKELRFTRAAQAQNFLVVAAIASAFGLLVFITALVGHPNFHWWMALPFFIAAGFLVRFSIRCARHAYLILTPLGVEIFPLLKPEKNLNLIYWSQLHSVDFENDNTLLKLHFDEQQTSGIILSLKPIQEKQRPLLRKALEGRLAESA